MVLDWLEFFISAVGDMVSFLSGFVIIGNISALHLIVVFTVSAMLVNVFVAKGRA